MKKAFLLLAFVLAFAYAADCSGSIEMGLPAVTEGEEKSGDIVLVQMKVVPGEGNAYVGVNPATDTSLQESVEIAVAVAEGLAGEETECDVLVTIVDETDYVQGPSGGAAFTLMGYSLFTGHEMRDDATMTGAVNEEGLVLPVGGLYEKAMSARAAGKDYFITPLQTVDEKLMLGNLEDITVYEVKQMGEAADFFFGGVVPEEKPLNLTVEPLPELAAYESADTPRFRQVAEGIMSREGKAIAGLEDQALREYFGERMLQQTELIEKGYYYSAANEAFLSYIMADSLSTIDAPDVEGKKEEVGECLESVKPAAITYENYDWIMGAEARLKRAENQIDLYGDLGSGTKEESYFVVYQLDFALAWCDAAKDMHSAASEIGGQPMEEEMLKEHVEVLMNLSSNYTEIGRSENYLNGVEMYEEGAYAGAAYELMYALSLEKQSLDMLQNNLTSEQIAELNRGERKSLWGNVFKAHSYYLMEMDDLGGAYAVAIFSRGMEDLHSGIGQQKYFEQVINLPEDEGNETAVEEVIEEEEECECPGCPEQDVCAVAYVLLLLPLFICRLR
ncbi:MAG: hypothetical protein GY852_00160 [bacterium]|nr:hypothetical protein [bacterium]